MQSRLDQDIPDTNVVQSRLDWYISHTAMWCSLAYTGIFWADSMVHFTLGQDNPSVDM